MKNKLKLYLLVCIAALCSCDDPFEDSVYQIYEVNPVSSYLETRPEVFSEWITVLKYVDLFNALNQATESFTVLAPDNEAIQAFYKKMNVTSIEGLGKEYAKNLAKYHIIGDSINWETFVKGGKIENKTLSDDYLTVTFDGEDESGGGFNSVYVNKEARVKEQPTEVSNGYVYVMGAVLTPLVDPLSKRIADAGIYKIFNEALQLTSWGDSLSIIYEEFKQPDGSTLTKKRDYTVLAVDDESYRKDGINSVNDLIALLEANNDYKDTENELFRYVAYHILDSGFSLLELETFDGAGKKKIWTTKAEAVMEISVEEDGEYYINYAGKEVKAQFIEKTSDMQAKNGILHNIDGYLPIWESVEPVEVYFDFCAYPEIASFIKSNATAGQQYQTMHASSEYRTAIQHLPCFMDVEWRNPAAPTSKFNYLDYFTVKSNSNWKNCMYYDMLILNLGYMGTVSMNTPAIIAGKYKVTLRFGYASSMAFIIKGNGGAMKFSFDGENEVEIRPMYESAIVEKTLNIHDCVVHQEIQFKKTGTHKLKIVVTDSDASQNANFRLYLDYLHFEPIID